VVQPATTRGDGRGDSELSFVDNVSEACVEKGGTFYDRYDSLARALLLLFGREKGTGAFLRIHIPFPLFYFLFLFLKMRRLVER
jgi:hypothetical protein